MNGLDPKYHTDKSIMTIVESGIDSPWFAKKTRNLPEDQKNKCWHLFTEAHAQRNGDQTVSRKRASKGKGRS